MEQIIQNTSKDNKLFIDDSIINGNFKCMDVSDEFALTSKKYLDPFHIKFTEDNFELYDIDYIKFWKTCNKLVFYKKNNTICVKELKDNEIVSLSFEKNMYLCVTIIELPLFFTSLKDEDDFPKFDIHISECQYSMKIYMNESEYIDIPVYMSHYNIIDTLKYIEELVEFLTKKDEYFIAQLCGHEMMVLSIIANGEVKSDILEYKLTDSGIVLLSEAFDNGFEVIEWHTFFKLVIDKKWIINFISKDE